MTDMQVKANRLVHPKGDVLFVDSGPGTAWRSETFFEKEPDTLAWIASMLPGEVLFDIGANVGMYSLWAWRQGAKVVAFEPESQNYAALNFNIFLNKADVVAYPIALARFASLAPLHVTQFLAGSSCHTFGSKTDFRGAEMLPVFSQGAVGMPLDSLVPEQLPQPHHIKIDVDGNEYEVFCGAEETLRKAQTVLIEIDSGRPEHLRIIAGLEDMGFGYDASQVERSRRTEGPFAGIGNYIFRRRARLSAAA
jgi:FkbM family methyltransferase